MAAAAALLMALGLRLLPPGGLWEWSSILRNDMGWSAGQTAGAYALMQAAWLMVPLLGILVDKLGPRRMVFFGLAVLGAGFVLLSQIRELWHLYIVSMVMSLGSIMCSWLPMMTMLNNWFDRRKTMAMASAVTLALVCGALLGVFMSVLLGWAIGGTAPDVFERYGWRATALFIGLVCLALAFPLSRLVRNCPEDVGLLPDGDALPPKARVQAAGGGYPTPDADWGYSWREAVRTKDFWLMTMGNTATLVTMGAILVHLGLFLDDRGYSLAMESTATVAVSTLLVAVFLLVGGYLGDKFSMRKMAFAFSSVLTLSAVLLVLAQGNTMVVAFAVLFGIGSGGGIVIMFSMRGRYFGRRAFATITGVSLVPTIILFWVGASVAGMVRDSSGTYNEAFLALAAITLVGGIAFLLMGEPPLQQPRSLAGDGPLEEVPSEMANP